MFSIAVSAASPWSPSAVRISDGDALEPVAAPLERDQRRLLGALHVARHVEPRRLVVLLLGLDAVAGDVRLQVLRRAALGEQLEERGADLLGRVVADRRDLAVVVLQRVVVPAVLARLDDEAEQEHEEHAKAERHEAPDHQRLRISGDAAAGSPSAARAAAWSGGARRPRRRRTRLEVRLLGARPITAPGRPCFRTPTNTNRRGGIAGRFRLAAVEGPVDGRHGGAARPQPAARWCWGVTGSGGGWAPAGSARSSRRATNASTGWSRSRSSRPHGPVPERGAARGPRGGAAGPSRASSRCSTPGEENGERLPDLRAGRAAARWPCSSARAR